MLIQLDWISKNIVAAATEFMQLPLLRRRTTARGGCTFVKQEFNKQLPRPVAARRATAANGATTRLTFTARRATIPLNSKFNE